MSVETKLPEMKYQGGLRVADQTNWREEQRRAEGATRRLQAINFLNTPPLFCTARHADAGETDPGFTTLGALTLPRDVSHPLHTAMESARHMVASLAKTRPEPCPPFTAFLGGFGTGKTHTAWAIAGELASVHGIRAKVVKCSALIRDLREPWNQTGGLSEAKRLEIYTSVPFLAIDEVSRHAFYGQQIHQHLIDVLDTRLEQERPTVLTSNEGQEGLAAIVGAALWDRFALGSVVDFGDQSYRRGPKG